MPFFFPETPDLPLPPGHRFPAAKYRMLRERAHAEGIFASAGLLPSPLATRENLLLVHDATYVDAMIAGEIGADAMRRIGVPWSTVLVERSLATVGGSIAAARAAIRDGISGQLAGGTHHAHRDFGSGYCVFNDLAVAALALLGEAGVARITILDLDVHQGDGTAALFAGERRVQTVSIHGEKNFPFRKYPSDLDIALADGTGDIAYLAALDRALGAVAAFAPDLLLYLSGADALACDRLGRLDLSHSGLMARDATVLRFARAQHIPVAIAIGGGYAEPIDETVEAYLGTFRTARAIYGF
ncbi:MAG: histone deacetylase [Hyphomicrobiaceae bacterium]|nr:histone deacetylase [Hyphomicrobiaceae bacterium]